MILYNTTFTVSRGVQEAFLQYLETEHFPHIYSFNLVNSHKLYKLHGHEDPDSITYCLQYFLPDMGTYEQYAGLLDYTFKKELKQQFGEKVLYFSTVLEPL